MEETVSPLSNKQGSVGAYIKQHIMSGLLNLSSIRGEAIYFASTHTSACPRAHVLVTGSDSNGEFNCLGKKMNKRHYAATLTTWYKGVILPQVPRISGLEQLPGFSLTILQWEQKLCQANLHLHAAPLFLKQPRPVQTCESHSRNNRPRKAQQGRQTPLTPFFFKTISCDVSVRWAPKCPSRRSLQKSVHDFAVTPRPQAWWRSVPELQP